LQIGILPSQHSKDRIPPDLLASLQVSEDLGGRPFLSGWTGLFGLLVKAGTELCEQATDVLEHGDPTVDVSL
jgi:hypothetical protein